MDLTAIDSDIACDVLTLITAADAGTWSSVGIAAIAFPRDAAAIDDEAAFGWILAKARLRTAADSGSVSIASGIDDAAVDDEQTRITI